MNLFARIVISSSLTILVMLANLLPTSLVNSQSTSSTATDECVPINKRICRLAVQITTSKARGAGTDNAVYFDIGPVGWKLNTRHNDFESGRTDEFNITPDPKLKLTTDDILWLRLQKKGLIGYNGTRDGFDGAWHPERLVIIVNGVVEREAKITEPLNSRCWFWRKAGAMDPPDPYASAVNFARTLRLQQNRTLRPVDKFTGFLTIGLKESGISGWLDHPEARECENGRRRNTSHEIPLNTCATGTVEASAKSTDGLATIDLNVRKVEFCGSDGRCYDQAIVPDLDAEHRSRYLRIEYKHHGRTVPKKDEHVRICGKLVWDTDNEGWWEIHPRDCQDVTFLTPRIQKCTRATSN